MRHSIDYTDKPIPSGDKVLQQLHGRIGSLEVALTEAADVHEETLISEELRRIREVIHEFNGQTNVITAFWFFKRKLKTLSLAISKYVTNEDRIPETLFHEYNVALYHLNEFNNVLESLT